jgi:starch synthase
MEYWLNRILFCSSEVHPFCKTGGLGDLSGSLPTALKQLGEDIRIILPAYPSALAKSVNVRQVSSLKLTGASQQVHLLETKMPGTDVPVYLVDCREAFDRAGDLYVDEHGQDWPDNARRFCLFSRAIVELAMNRATMRWKPHIVHCNDWQTGLVPALLSRERARPGVVFSIHNLGYQGDFSWDQFEELSLPQQLWAFDSMEHYDRFLFIKGGLSHADRLITVSPTYAEEIKTEAYGCGLHPLLQYRAERLTGILNGIDERLWDPRTDPALVRNYSVDELADKYANKRALQKELGLVRSARKVLISHIGRLTDQKGTDLILDIIPDLMKMDGVQLVLLGSGDRSLERAFRKASRKYPRKLTVRVGYDEELAHRIEAGSDIFLMPSRYEPCGLNQMYSMRYGTIPVVRLTGGLADTVVNADESTLADGSATGFGFTELSARALLESVTDALQVYRQFPELWRTLMVSAMSRDFGWRQSGARYLELYGTVRRRKRTRRSRV